MEFPGIGLRRASVGGNTWCDESRLARPGGLLLP